MSNLWSDNTPDRFWRCMTEIPAEVWDQAIRQASGLLSLNHKGNDIDSILQTCLGEGQFGNKHWQMSLPLKTYYLLKPIIPPGLKRRIRHRYGTEVSKDFCLDFPIESRFVLFLWETMKYALDFIGKQEIDFIYFWPKGRRFALILTHDVETKQGLRRIEKIVELETGLGFRSSFNFVPELYPIDKGLIKELRENGFEVGIHGLNHDGWLYSSEALFNRRAKKINRYLKDYEAVGFRSPLTMRNPAWMQELDIDYDLSFFDSDPYEPIAGGTMSIYPFQLGRFVELPYTLMQDSTLINILNEKTPNLWLKKIEFIEKYHGMALVNSHPDYLSLAQNLDIYGEFLEKVKERAGYWHSLPRDAANWWRRRITAEKGQIPSEAVIGKIFTKDQQIQVKVEETL